GEKLKIVANVCNCFVVRPSNGSYRTRCEKYSGTKKCNAAYAKQLLPPRFPITSSISVVPLAAKNTRFTSSLTSSSNDPNLIIEVFVLS
ncbi:unnamed protein product, partial [Rotaria magnacalcarata]